MKLETAIKYIESVKTTENCMNLKSFRMLEDVQKTLAECQININGALAVLTQNKTFPADVKLAKAMLNDAL